MQTCPWCGWEVAQGSRFCASCGGRFGTSAPVSSADAAPTVISPNERVTPPPSRSGRASAGSGDATFIPRPVGFRSNFEVDDVKVSPPPAPNRTGSRPASHREEGRFFPGKLIAGRYRLIALLGRGGMGEVYRADDLSLGQQVALKFLPESMTDEDTLERFRNEVRIARRISHPNVCRVYDIGEADKQIFLSMEYVDGEDLSSLLRRIGRLPSDKAVEIARKICAGVAAAHDKGVLHRDLKPSNIMLDGRGEVLVMDFGLAGIAHEIEDVRSGTPAYMAPEQLAGKEVTERSDIYSLGLVLYELFTGKVAFEGKTLEEIVRQRRTSIPRNPSTIVRDMDPVVERAILHCLETDPENRPSTAIMVSAALPGGDPLAAALAAGETPSPQLVAAAGERAGISVRTAAVSLALILAGLVAIYILLAHNNGLQKLDLPYSAEVMSQRARDMVKMLGYEAPPLDTAGGFYYDGDYLEYLDHAGGEHPDWDKVLRERPPVLNYWQRQSPSYLVAEDILKSNLLLPGEVNDEDPPPTLSGMVMLSLDAEGRLIDFTAIPPQKDIDDTAAPPPYDWAKLFQLAGLDISQFHPATPQWTSLGTSDHRVAWNGTWPETEVPLRVEAASWQGKPVYFQLIGPWTKADRMPSSDSGAKAPEILLVVFLLVLFAGAIWLARRNYVSDKSDPQGAFRLGVLIVILQMLAWIFVGHFVPSLASFGLFVLAASGAVFLGALFCIVYLALEPYVRRHWPHAIISWSRLMSGRLRDPLVGRDILFGLLLGISWTLIFALMFAALERIHAAPQFGSVTALMGTRHDIGGLLTQITTSIQATLVFFFLMFVFRVILRKPWLAALAFVAFWTGIKAYGGHHFALIIPAYAAVYGIAAFVVLRFGFVALAVGIFTVDLVVNVPFTTDFSSWYIGGPIFVVLLVAALAVWGCYTALAGQKVLKERLFE